MFTNKKFIIKNIKISFIVISIMLFSVTYASSNVINREGKIYYGNEENRPMLDIMREKIDNTELYQTLTFGKFEQDGNFENGSEDIEWIVVDKKEDRVFLVALKALMNKQVMSYDGVPHWEKSIIRKWLNEEFYIQAFNEKEREVILDTLVKKSFNPIYGTNSGNDTIDKIYIMGAEEATTYFNEVIRGQEIFIANRNILRQAKGTDYAFQSGLRGIFVENQYHGFTNYWLRTPGQLEERIWVHNRVVTNYQCIVHEYGNINYKGSAVYSKDDGVRPCMWIKY